MNELWNRYISSIEKVLSNENKLWADRFSCSISAERGWQHVQRRAAECIQGLAAGVECFPSATRTATTSTSCAADRAMSIRAVESPFPATLQTLPHLSPDSTDIKRTTEIANEQVNGWISFSLSHASLSSKVFQPLDGIIICRVEFGQTAN